MSSGSWSGVGGGEDSGAGGGGGGGGGTRDILDLDRYMRAPRPPPRPDLQLSRRNELVVDAGGVARKWAGPGPGPGAGPGPGPGRTAGPTPGPGPPALSAGGSSSSGARRPHTKRFSHDSGLSDGSYARRKPRPHRREAAGGSSESLRAFRAVCERALLDQQAQIARVAQLCERLTETRLAPPAPLGAPPAPAPSPPGAGEAPPAASSDATSSSRSSGTRDARRRDKHRTAQCKTYKIIMNKLDELERVLAVRARAGPTVPSVPTGASSRSVSVSDKLVATEPALLLQTAAVTSRPLGGALCSAPPDTRHYSAARCEEVLAHGYPRCGFDLDDPLRLYSQAKRLQALPTATQRPRLNHRAIGDTLSEQVGEHVGEHVGERSGAQDARETTLCALCRSYWRSFRQYLATQIVSAEP